MKFFHMQWMLQATLEEIYTDYLFPVLELIMEQSLADRIWDRLPKALYSDKTVKEF